MTSANNREVIHPDPNEEKSKMTADEVENSGTETPAPDDGRPGYCNDDNLLSGDRMAHKKKPFLGSGYPVDHAYEKGSKPGSRPELETTLHDLESHRKYFEHST